MPNWCSNIITLSHRDPAMIDRAINTTEFLMEFLPTPKELVDTVSGWPGVDLQAVHEAQQAANIEKYGFKDWYDWNVANWGTKWDFSLEYPERLDANTVAASFDSAWSPPVTAYEKLTELGFEVTALYYESGMGFVGKWHNGVDEYYEYGGQSSETVRNLIGEELDEYFGISEQMADYEAEKAEEENS